MPDIFVKPARDAAGAPLLVRDPLTMKPLDESGEWKEKISYWARRLADSDVVEATPPAPDQPAPAPAAKPAENLITPAA